MKNIIVLEANTLNSSNYNISYRTRETKQMNVKHSWIFVHHEIINYHQKQHFLENIYLILFNNSTLLRYYLTHYFHMLLAYGADNS